jgi:hypothetical protein
MKSKIFLAGVVTVSPILASAQSWSSFTAVGNIQDVLVSSSSLTHTVTALSAPSVTIASQTYAITDIFGFWILSNNDITSTANSVGVWSVSTNNAGSGGIAGWKTNPNTGILPNGSQTFTFNSFSGTQDEIGFHVRLATGAGPLAGQTVYIKGNPVPEPATMSALAIGALGLLRRKKK